MSFKMTSPYNIDWTPIYRREMEDGVLAKANKNLTIHINNNADISSAKEKHVLEHEKCHLRDLANGKLDYTDEYILWENVKYPRQNGKVKYKNKWLKEGDESLPWEATVYNKKNIT